MGAVVKGRPWDPFPSVPYVTTSGLVTELSVHSLVRPKSLLPVDGVRRFLLSCTPPMEVPRNTCLFCYCWRGQVTYK